MKNWLDIQRLYPFFWLWLNAWLKSKGADFIQIQNDLNSNIKIKFIFPFREKELTDEMLNEILDDAGIRVFVSFDSEDMEPAWKYVVFKNNGITNLWCQTYSSNYIFKDRKTAQQSAFLYAIEQHDISLKKQNSIEQY
jgi:hypothetical protein